MTREESINLAKYEETPYYFQSLINKIYDEFNLELEALENRSCENCVYYLSDNGNYPLEPCGECSRWYADRWESK